MDTVPNIITEKDYLYLKDLFNKNYTIYKEMVSILKSIKNKELKDLLDRIKNMHEDHMYFIISSLKKENYFDGEDYE